MEQLIRSWGFSVEAASDGDEALERVKVFRPGIVLTDLVMPRMSGLELLRALREQGEHMATVILTAQGTVETAAEAIKQGAYEYLTKPVDLQRLRILLAKISQELRQCIEFTARRMALH
jgi:DNA-binding NtrC family response regulator